MSLGRRRENIIHVFAGQQCGVAFKSRGYVREILSRSKLRRINKDRDHQRIALRARFAHQTEMALVQRAHRRHKADAAVRALNFTRDRDHALRDFD